MDSLADVVVVGGGAAGLAAAISASRVGARVVICEKNPQLGKKILATGNGRCNLLNDDLSAGHYNVRARDLVSSVFSKFGKTPILEFFDQLGLKTVSQGGRRFPATNQASSVLSVLQGEIERLGVQVELEFTCSGLNFSGDSVVASGRAGKTLSARRAILAGGGKAYPALGSDGTGLDLAAGLGHRIVPPVPAAVPLVVKDRLCHLLQGQRISASVTAVHEGSDRTRHTGELLFTKYGLSGTAVIDASRPISVALNREGGKSVDVEVDLVPFLAETELALEIEKRVKRGLGGDRVLIGILPNKISAAFGGLVGKSAPREVARQLKAMRFSVSGTRGWNEGEFTAGGVDTQQITDTMESKLRPGLYLAGEVLDVDGERGGYNLAWAWASGWIAGYSAAHSLTAEPGAAK